MAVGVLIIVGLKRDSNVIRNYAPTGSNFIASMTFTENKENGHEMISSLKSI